MCNESVPIKGRASASRTAKAAHNARAQVGYHFQSSSASDYILRKRNNHKEAQSLV
jgi:hypothetical protein